MPDAISGSPVPQSAISGLDGEGTKVLVVDDEEDIRRLVAMNLTRAGFDVLTAADGREALALARAELPPLCVLDLMLPDMQGTEVCAQLRADPDTAGIYVIMLTARGEEIDRLSGFEVGADDYVTKPFSPRVLIARVRSLLRRRGLQEIARFRCERC